MKLSGDGFTSLLAYFSGRREEAVDRQSDSPPLRDDVRRVNTGTTTPAIPEVISPDAFRPRLFDAPSARCASPALSAGRLARRPKDTLPSSTALRNLRFPATRPGHPDALFGNKNHGAKARKSGGVDLCPGPRQEPRSVTALRSL